MKKLLILIFTIVTTLVSAQTTGSLRGFVYDKETGEPMMFSNVVLENTQIGTTTDVNGYFVLSKIKSGTYNIKVTSLGYETYIESIKVEKNKVVALKIELSPSATELETVEVKGKQEMLRTESQVSVEKITSTDIQQMPSIGGQADLAQYIQVLPGVVFSGDQGGQLYIRGGSAIHNKVLLDGMVVYNPFHSIGLFSVFETDIIRNADIYTGGFSAQYGGRISSVMDITTKDGNKKHFTGKLSASTFGANLLLEGPIVKDSNYTLSYVFSAKNSYLSKTSTSIYSYMNKELPYDYLDLYGKLTLSTDNGSKINVFGLNFTDKVNQYEAIADFNWSNKAFGTNFLIIPGTTSALVEGVIAYSDYTMNMKEITSNQNQMSNIGGFNVGMSVTNFFGDDRLKYGMEMEGNTTKTAYQLNDTITDYSTEIGLYAIYKLMYRQILFEPSLRLSYYASLGDLFLEPRLSAKWNVSNKFRLKLATGVYSQTFLDTKSDRDVVNLFTGYLTVSPDLNIVNTFQSEPINSFVQKSNHFIFGAEYDILRNLYLNFEVYYKTMSNLVSINRDRLYTDDAEHSDKPDYSKKEYTVENGNAYGADFSLKYDDGRLYVWTIYSLGKVIREGETQTYAPHYDRRHNINVLINYQMGKSRDFELSFRWNYGSGFPYSPTASMVEC
jgi:hypothetical protein